MKYLITTLGVLACAGSLAFAQDKPPGGQGGRERPNPEEAFKKMDTNSDGAVSLEEYKASPRGQRNPERAEQGFKRLDKDSDGKLTLEEFKTARPPRGPGGPGGKPPGEKPSAE